MTANWSCHATETQCKGCTAGADYVATAEGATTNLQGPAVPAVPAQPGPEELCSLSTLCCARPAHALPAAALDLEIDVRYTVQHTQAV